MGLAAAALCLSLLGNGPGDDAALAERLILDFDGAWNRGDVDALMAPVSSRFGCDMYGEIDVARLEDTFRRLLDRFAGSTCRTEIVDFAPATTDMPVIRAFTRRRIESKGRLLEELDHVLYLRREWDGLRITGLEDFDADALERVKTRSSDGTVAYANPSLAYRFDAPAGMFVVPVQPSGAALDHVLVRAADLGDEIELFVIQTCVPFEVERALDADLDAWTAAADQGVVEERADVRLPGAPTARAAQAIARYVGASCSLSGGVSAKRGRRMVRVYAQLDRCLLLAIDLRSSADRYPVAHASFDRLVESLAFDAPPGAEYGRLVLARKGLGPVARGVFRDARSGFTMNAPRGSELSRIATNGLFHLVVLTPVVVAAEPDAAFTPLGGRAAPGSESTASIEVHVEAMALMDPDMPLADFANAQDLARAACVGQSGGALVVTPRAPRTIAGVPGITIERRTRTRESVSIERCAYFVRNGIAFTARVESTEPAAPAAATALWRVLDTIRFDAK